HHTHLKRTRLPISPPGRFSQTHNATALLSGVSAICRLEKQSRFLVCGCKDSGYFPTFQIFCRLFFKYFVFYAELSPKMAIFAPTTFI
ncbi:MAG: hypothetical protein J6Y99_09890, partial [Bacteroidales bacterium]|nr:hypothetical protein [Bacteroidales bacterium]